MKLGPSDIPCVEVMEPNYVTYERLKVPRGTPTIAHEWFVESQGRWIKCNPLVCRECQRNAEACAAPAPMA